MFKNFCIIFLAGILAFCSFELFLRYSPFSRGISPIEHHETLGYWHKPTFSNITVKECYRNTFLFDTQGRVLNTTPVDKDKKNVILLGDSFIEAIMVANKDIIHNSLSRYASHNYNYLNYGLSGTGPVQQYVILRNKVSLKNSHLVLHFVNFDSDLKESDPELNNTMDRPRPFAYISASGKFKIIPPRKMTLYDKVADAMSNLEFYFLAKKTAYVTRDTIKQLLAQLPSTKNNTTEILSDNSQKTSTEKTTIKTAGWKNLTAAIREIQNYILASNPQTRYKVLFFNSSPKQSAAFQNFLVRNNISYIDIDNEMLLRNMQYQVFTCDSHWNSTTHKNVAKLIADKNIIQ